MLRKLITAALLRPQWRPHLLPLVELGKLQRVRTASGTMPLRKAVIRTAYKIEDPELRAELVRIVVAHDRGETEAWTSEHLARILTIGRETADPALRRRVASVLRIAKYSPGFLRWVERQQFRNPDTGNEVAFHSLSPSEQKKIHDQWVAGKKDWAAKHKPEGLGKHTLLTPEKFDEVKEGDLLWISWSPNKLHKVVGRSKTQGGKARIDMVQVDPNDHEVEGERRALHKSSVEKGEHEIHLMPKAEASPDAPAAEAPAAEAPAPKEKKAPPPKAEEPPKPAAPKEEAPEEPKDEAAAEKKHAPTGKYKDRKELRGVGKKKLSDKADISSSLRGLFLPQGVPAEHRAHIEQQLGIADYELLDLAYENADKALKKPDGKVARKLMRQGHTPESIKALHEALQKKLKDVKGRLYNKTVLDVANAHDLEGEDADALYSFKHDKPHMGRKLAPEELMRKFLAKAKPETRERMQGMPVADFMAMYNAIMADEEEEQPAA